MLSDASVQTANDHDSEKWLEQVLPLIRFRKCRPWTYFPVMHEVLGLYPSEIVVIRKRINTPIPESAYMADGAGVLKEMGRKASRATSIPFVDVSQVVSFPRPIIGAFDNFKVVAAKKTISFSVLQQDAPNVYRALPLMLGTRYHQKKQIPLTGLYRAQSLFHVLSSATYNNPLDDWIEPGCQRSGCFDAVDFVCRIRRLSMRNRIYNSWSNEGQAQNEAQTSSGFIRPPTLKVQNCRKNADDFGIAPGIFYTGRISNAVYIPTILCCHDGWYYRLREVRTCCRRIYGSWVYLLHNERRCDPVSDG